MKNLFTVGCNVTWCQLYLYDDGLILSSFSWKMRNSKKKTATYDWKALDHVEVEMFKIRMSMCDNLAAPKRK